MNGVRSITERGSHVFALHQIQYKFTFVREPLVKRLGKPAALVREEEETMPEKTHDDPPNSTSFSPLMIWWKSKTRHARSGMKSLSMQSGPIRRQLGCETSARKKKKDGCLPFPSMITNSQIEKSGVLRELREN